MIGGGSVLVVISEQAERPTSAASVPTPWWRGAVIYEIYPRSFADGSGDGTGDLAGVRARLPYLRDLGVDAVWFTPWYPSPMADGGYDVTDYRAIDPGFGDLREAELLIAEARELGIRTIVDVVPNHVSDQHPWFQRGARVADPGSGGAASVLVPARAGVRDGELPPNGWVSEFGGSAWTAHHRSGRVAGRVVPASVRARASPT